jgi:hypothetical protein
VIDRREILDIANQTLLTPHVVEKDYALGWLLAGIYAHEELAENWIFKGGTCLKKCFFETYRFSEDLDFTLRDEPQLDEAFLKRVFAEIGAWIYDETGIEIPADQQEFEIYRNPRGKLSCSQLQGTGFTHTSASADQARLDSLRARRPAACDRGNISSLFGYARGRDRGTGLRLCGGIRRKIPGAGRAYPTARSLRCREPLAQHGRPARTATVCPGAAREVRLQRHIITTHRRSAAR